MGVVTRRCARAMVVAGLIATGGCTGGLFPSKGPQTPEAFCATLPSIGYGHFFYCGTVQGNLQGGLPNGWTGYCMPANTNALGLVGYGAALSNGGKLPVQSFADAQADCKLAGGCSTVIMCTRE